MSTDVSEDFTSQKIANFIVTGVRTSKLNVISVSIDREFK
jgi:hypothetical protein